MKLGRQYGCRSLLYKRTRDKGYFLNNNYQLTCLLGAKGGREDGQEYIALPRLERRAPLR